MKPLERLESLNLQIKALLQGLPDSPNRTQLHGDLAAWWAQTDTAGATRQQRLVQLHREQLRAELILRQTDETLTPTHVSLLQNLLDLPYSWQRLHLPLDTRPQVYRPLLSTSRPNWRAHLAGVLVLTQNGPQGRVIEAHEQVGRVLLCSLAHGIEAFDSLADLHVELSERLDDPLQALPLLRLLTRPDDPQQATQAERLRYDWFADDAVEHQIERLYDAQRARLANVWRADPPHQALRAQALNVEQHILGQGALATRYALLLEKNLPAWIGNTSQQGLSEITQSLQELAIAFEQAGAPGIPTLEQFRQHNSLLAWADRQIRQRLHHDLGLDLDPTRLRISVTQARQIGPLLNPLLPSSYIPAASRPQVGDTIELVSTTYSLQELALLNVAWLDVDYWLTARVHDTGGKPVPGVDAGYLKQLVRSLNVGSSYADFLRSQLLDSADGRWRQAAYIRISHARMRAEVIKARYAGHFAPDRRERGYQWANTVLQHADSSLRPSVEGHRLQVRQLLVKGSTVEGVLLIGVEDQSVPSFVLYAPDVPDRRPWREYRNTRELLRSLRDTPELRSYVLKRLPHALADSVGKMLLKGRLGPHVQRPPIEGHLFKAMYNAEVQALLAEADAGSRTTGQVDAELAIEGAWLLVDLICLVLPNRVLTPLAFGRMALAIWEGAQALAQEDREGVWRHTYQALGQFGDALTSSMGGSTRVRRLLRNLPHRPPLPLPKRLSVKVDSAKLRYRIDDIHEEGIYEKSSPYPGVPQYYVGDKEGLFYQVTFDGRRWRVIDPDQPNAYLQLPLKRLENGDWCIDSPVFWHDGLPDLHQLFDDCRSTTALHGTAVQGLAGLFEDEGQLYLHTQAGQLLLRGHLVQAHYHLLIPPSRQAAVPAWATVRREASAWQVRVRQTGLSSDWMALPGDYSVMRGNS
ncbi:DUF6543 domain-containing protein [Pseudomonas sp. PS01300]|uniref:dermonecrotic toxin domain-containing protein n=1 Tax=Pseudomonas sp. PS01300 TaxID=2991436 RepID=UPI00249C2385|nr:DUF6543 domain-containing protein [Pseudomonas sp. PS01300]